MVTTLLSLILRNDQDSDRMEQTNTQRTVSGTKQQRKINNTKNTISFL